jgi:hypothetical protein
MRTAASWAEILTPEARIPVVQAVLATEIHLLLQQKSPLERAGFFCGIFLWTFFMVLGLRRQWTVRVLRFM